MTLLLGVQPIQLPPLYLKVLLQHAQYSSIISQAYSNTHRLDFTLLNGWFPTLAWCAGEEAAQAATDSTAGSVLSLQPADISQKHLGEEPATQLHSAAQPQPQPEQPVASNSQEAEAAAAPAADSTAEAAASSSGGGGGGRYMSVPPSSLWGPLVEVGVNTSSAAARPTGFESQRLPSAAGNMPGDTGHSQHGSPDQSVYHQHTSEAPAVEHEEMESPPTDQQSAEEDASTAETEADLARAQRAQREALRAEDASLQSSRKSLMEVRETIQQEQAGRMSQNAHQVTLSGMAQTDTEGRQGGDQAPVHEADRKADDTMLDTGAEFSNEQASHEREARPAGEGVAQTEATLVDAQEAQRPAVQAQQQALAEEPRDLMQLRQDLEQQSGQLARSVCCSALCNCCTCNNSLAPMPAVCHTLHRLACHSQGVQDACSLTLAFST